MQIVKMLVLVAVLTLSVTAAHGLSIPVIPPMTPVFITTNNVDSGSFYVGPDGTYSGSEISNLTRIAGPGALDREDSWGMFGIDVMKRGIADGPNSIKEDKTKLAPVYYNWSAWTNGSQRTALAGIFWGGHDDVVTLGSGGTALTTYVSQVHFEVYAVDYDDVSVQGPIPPDYDPNARTAENRYEGWISDNSRKVKLLSGTSVFYRFVGQELAHYAFMGTTDVYIDVDENDPTGLWNGTWGLGKYYTAPNGQVADVFLSFDIKDPGSSGWSAESYDDGGVFVVPEPMTMLAVGFGLAGIGRYVRRRIA